MSKNQIVPADIQKKFERIHFKPGTAVYFSWMGQKQYGHVKRTKPTNWGVQYMVVAQNGRTYPCGIQINKWRTKYEVGIIFYAETLTIKRTGSELRIDRPEEPDRIAEVLSEPDRAEDAGGDDNPVLERVVDKPSRKNTKVRSTRSSADMDTASSINGDIVSAPKKRAKTSNVELDSAIEKQKNFLNGFVKKD